MTSVDKAAIAWSIAIVVAGVAIAGAGMSGTLPEADITAPTPTMKAPMQEKTSTDPFADIAKQTMSQAEEREKAMAEQMGGSMMEEKVSVTAPKVTEPPKMTTPKMTASNTATVSMPTGTSVPGCEETNACYIPASVSVSVGGTVTWSNDDTAAHTVTSGSPTGGPDGVFDSSLVMGGKTFEFTFQNAGTYDYFCMVHPWMTGTVKVG